MYELSDSHISGIAFPLPRCISPGPLLTPATGSSPTMYRSFSAGPSTHHSDASSQKSVWKLCCSSDRGTDEGVAKASVKAIGPSGHNIDHFGECNIL